MGALAATLVVALASVLVVIIAPASRANIVAAPPCADVLFIGARGSGNSGPGTPGWVPTSSDPYGLGGSVEAVRQYTLNGLGARRRVATISVEYPANGVLTVPFRADVYFSGLATGVSWTEQALSARNCPGEAIVLAGFSQGAMVMHRVLRYLVATNSSLKDRVAVAVLVGDGDRVPGDSTLIDGGASAGKQGIGLDWTAQSGSSWTAFPAELRDKILEVCEPDDLVCDQPSTSVAALNTHLGYSTSSASVRLAGSQTTLRVLDVPKTSPMSMCADVGVGVAAQVPVDVLGGATLQWRVQPGSSLPAGITLSATGNVIGARTTAGAWTSVVEVRNTVRTPASAWVSANVIFRASCGGIGARVAPRATATVTGTLRQEDRATWTFPLTNTGDQTWTASQVIVNVVTPSGAGYLVPCSGATNVSLPPGGNWTCTAATELGELGTSVGTLFWQSQGSWYNQAPSSPWSVSASVTQGPLTGTGTTPAAASVTVGDFTTVTSSVRNDSSRTMTFGWIDYYVEGPNGGPVMAACLADTNITLAPGQTWTCDAGFRADQRGTYHGWLKYRLPSGEVYAGPYPAGSERTWQAGSIPTVSYAQPGYATLAGSQIQLHGKNLDLASRVTFGGSAGQIVSAGVPDTLFVQAPAHSAGDAPIVVTGPDGTSDPLPFLYRGPASPASRASLGAAGLQANGTSSTPALSDDGVWVAFQSQASNLVPGDTNGVEDVFLRNTVTGSTIRVTDNAFRAQANGPSRSPDVSANGQVIAFESDATDLWPQPTTAGHVWVRQNSSTALLPVDLAFSTGGLGNGRATHPSIDDAGRYVAFSSTATNLVAGDSRTFAKVFLRDMNGGTMLEGSTSSEGVPANGPSTEPVLSGDGKVVAFKSWATNLVPGDGAAHHPGLYVKELASGTVTRIDVNDNGEASNGTTLSAASISQTGILVAYSTNATNLDTSTPDTNGVDDVYGRYVDIGRMGVNEFTWRVSLIDDYSQSPKASHDPVVAENANGDIAFLHDGSDLGIQSGPATATQVYVRSTWSDVATLTPAGTVSTGPAGGLAMSGDGSMVAFDSAGADLIDGDTNGARDVFVAPVPAVEGVPAQVTGVGSLPSSQHAIVTWAAVPAVHPVTYITRLWTQPTGGTQVGDPQYGTSPYAVFGNLTDGQTVYAEVTAQNSKGLSDPSVRVAVTPVAVVPETPTAVTLSPLVRVSALPGGNGDGLWQMDVSWDEPSTSPGVSFEARALTQPVGGTLAAAGGIGPDSPRTVQLQLQAGRTFYVEVVATNAVGESVPSAPIAVTTPAVASFAPQSPAATAGNASASVSWHTPLYTGGAPLTGYQVTASPGGRTCTTVAVSPSPATGPAIPETCEVTGLTNGVAYQFVVRARTAAGLGLPSAATAAVTPATVPSVVPSLVVSYPASRSVKATWQAPASSGGAAVTGYQYRIRNAASSSWGAWVTVGNVRSATIKSLTLGARYYVQVAAKNRVGVGPAAQALTRAIT